MLSPSDHLRMLVELLRPVGPELARRWLAALLLIPADEREAAVEAIETRIAQTYGRTLSGSPETRLGSGTPARRAGSGVTQSRRGSTPATLDVVAPPVQRDGYVEQLVTTYQTPAPARTSGKPAADRKRRA